MGYCQIFFFSSRRRHTRWNCDWSSDVCSSDLEQRSSARPELLERTAACSRQALEGFPGDPFTVEYAMEVKRCGADAIEARSEERRVGKEGRSRWAAYHCKKYKEW